MTKLYELSDEYNALIEALNNDETDEALKERLLTISASFNDKVENIGKLVLSLESDCQSMKYEEQRLSQRRKSVENKIDWLKEYLKTELIRTEKDKVEGGILTVSLRKNPVSVNVVNAVQIPDRYWRVIPEVREPDKKAILDQFKTTGEIIDGCEIITDKKSIMIR